MQIGKYKYYQKLDSMENDIRCVRNKTVSELMMLCEEDPQCIGFNSLGFLKHKTLPETQLTTSKYFGHHDGLYVHVERYESQLKLETREKLRQQINAYCIPNVLEDTEHVPNKIAGLEFKWSQVINDLKVTYELQKLFTDNTFGSTKSGIATALNHLNVWIQVLYEWKPALIIGQNVQITDQSTSEIELLLQLFNNSNSNSNNNNNTDCLHLESTNVSLDKNTFVYLLYPNGAKKLYEHIEEYGIKTSAQHLLMDSGILVDVRIPSQIDMIHDMEVDNSILSLSDTDKIYVTGMNSQSQRLLPIPIYIHYESRQRKTEIGERLQRQGIRDFTFIDSERLSLIYSGLVFEIPRKGYLKDPRLDLPDLKCQLFDILHQIDNMTGRINLGVKLDKLVLVDEATPIYFIFH